MAKKNDKEIKQLYWIIGIMAFIILVVIFIYVSYWKANHFEYLDFKWEKIKYDKLDLYHTKMLLTRQDKSQVYYNLYLRNDPRKNNILINANIKLKSNNFTYITIDDDLKNCQGLNPALVDLSAFISAINLDVKAGVLNKTIAEENNVPFVTCDNKNTNSIITLEVAGKKQGEENYTQILQNGDCYMIKIQDCEIRKATERFILGLISYSKGQRI